MTLSCVCLPPNAAHWHRSTARKQTNKQTNKQASKQTNKQTNKIVARAISVRFLSFCYFSYTAVAQGPEKK
jgi:hypothetical protein